MFTQIRSGAKCWLDIYHWGAGRAVTRRIRDIGQNILQSSFRTGRSKNRSYCHIFFHTAFFEEAFIRNIIIIIIKYHELANEIGAMWKQRQHK